MFLPWDWLIRYNDELYLLSGKPVYLIKWLVSVSAYSVHVCKYNGLSILDNMIHS